MRPQLLDRFGLAVNVGTLIDTETRLAMVLDRMQYDAHPAALLEAALPEMEDLTVRCSPFSAHSTAQHSVARPRDICSLSLPLRQPLTAAVAQPHSCTPSQPSTLVDLDVL